MHRTAEQWDAKIMPDVCTCDHTGTASKAWTVARAKLAARGQKHMTPSSKTTSMHAEQISTASKKWPVARTKLAARGQKHITPSSKASFHACSAN